MTIVFFEIAYITGGTAVHTLNGVSSLMKKGDYFIVDYGSCHSYTNSRDFSLINCLFLPQMIDESLNGCECFEQLIQNCLIRYYRQYRGHTPENRILSDTNQTIFSIIQKMCAEYSTKQTGYQELLRGYLLEILILSIRQMIQCDLSCTQTPQTQNSAVAQAILYLQKHYAQKSLLSRFCAENHYSLQYISTRFYKETGMGAVEYLQKIRIEKACELLSGTDLSIQEVARLVGYEDAKSFYQLFRKRMHLAPREYRKMSKLSC